MFPTIKNYQIVEEIGRGGMATVYKAWQPSLSRIVALKVLPPYFAHDEELVMRFRREAHAVAKLRHPNIVQVFDFHQEGELFYLAMEYMSGGSLQDKLSEVGRLPSSEALKLVRQVAEGLNHAHNKGFIHRDIKPSNILISDEGDAVITDFGIVKALKSTKLTKTVMGGLGTSEYMAPEQASGEKVSPASDLYSLGVVLYETLTGDPPFIAESAIGVVSRHATEEPAKPSSINKNISAEVDALILKLLAKEQQNRFTSAMELVAAVNNLGSGSASSTPKITLVRRDTRVASRLPRFRLPGLDQRRKKEEDSSGKQTTVPKKRFRPSTAMFARLIMALGLIISAGIIGFFAGYLIFPTQKTTEVVKATPSQEAPKPKTKAKKRKLKGVESPVVKSIEISPSAALLTVDDTATFRAQGVLSDGSSKVIEVSWSVSDKAIAEIDANGLLRTLAPGSFEVKVEFGKHSATAKVDVMEKQGETTETPQPADEKPGSAPVKRYRALPVPPATPEPEPPAPSIPLVIN